jgi:hypothetical protein
VRKIVPSRLSHTTEPPDAQLFRRVVGGAAGGVERGREPSGRRIGDGTSRDHRDQQSVDTDRFNVVVLREHAGVVIVGQDARCELVSTTGEGDNGCLTVVFEVMLERAASSDLLLELLL